MLFGIEYKTSWMDKPNILFFYNHMPLQPEKVTLTEIQKKLRDQNLERLYNLVMTQGEGECEYVSDWDEQIKHHHRISDWRKTKGLN